MKILFDVREANRNHTGIGTYVRNLAREAMVYDDPNVVCRCVPAAVEPPPPVNRAPSLALQAFNFLRNVTWKQACLPALAYKEKADVLVCMDPISPLASPTRTALMIYDLIFLTAGAQRDAWTRYWRAMVPRCARKADMIFTLSQASKSKITELLGIPGEKIVVVRSGVASHFGPWRGSEQEAGRIRKRLGLPETFLLSVGAHDVRRNVKTLLVAYERMKRTGFFPCRLVIIGQKTPFFEEIWQTTRSLGLEKDVLFLDYVTNEELSFCYAHASLYLYPSSEEGFGYTPLEAMACGCPVITSRASSLPEVVGDAALLVNPTDPDALVRAIEQVLLDPDLRKGLIEKGFERVKMFSWRRGVQDIIRACVRLAGRNSGKAGNE